MKIRSAVALIGLAISFALPTFGQQNNAPDSQIVQQLHAIGKKSDEAFLKGDAAALAALYTEDAVEVTDSGTLYGREAIEKHYADLFQKEHFSNYLVKADQYSPHMIGTTDKAWSNGEWSVTLQGKTGDPIPLRGYWSEIYVREGDAWKVRMQTWNITPAPPTATE